MKRILSIFIVFGISANAMAQPGQKAPANLIAAMEKLHFLEGEWEGEGWIQTGPEKSYFTVSEVGTSKLDGAIFIFDGIGYDKTTEEVIHQAYATVSFNLSENAYEMKAFRLDGGAVDADLSVDDDGKILWGFEIPQGKLKYIIENLNGKWHETGFIDMNGREFQFFEMTLTKK